jgi:hypothetical protein
MPVIPSGFDDNISIESPAAAMCRIGLLEWDVAQLAGMSLYSEIGRLRRLPHAEEARGISLHPLLYLRSPTGASPSEL